MIFKQKNIHVNAYIDIITIIAVNRVNIEFDALLAAIPSDDGLYID